MSDILFKTDDYVFSYRAAGICIQNGMVLLQKPSNDEGYAFPGGHCALGETSEETLIQAWIERGKGTFVPSPRSPHAFGCAADSFAHSLIPMGFLSYYQTVNFQKS